MTSHLLGLQVEHFKRLQLVNVTFDAAGGVVAIMGENEAGKSSLLDALEVLIAGRRAPKMEQPIHTGEDHARIVGTFDDIVVTRTYKANGTTGIEVKAADGTRVSNAEELLKRLYSHVALDPLAFSRLTDQEQVAALLPLIGFDPAPLDAERDEAYAQRTVVNREVAAAKARVDAIPLPAIKLPDEPIDVLKLNDDFAVALGANNTRDQLEREIQEGDETIARLEREAEGIRSQIATLNERLEANALEQSREAEAQAEGRRALEGMVVQDVEAIRTAISTAKNTNDAISQQRERARIAQELADAEARSQALTEKIEDVAARREAALAAAKMPVPGLSINDDGILTLNGVPFSQASTGVKIRTGTAIAMALNPDLRLIVIRDASLLDAGNREVIDTLAKANGYTVLMEIADESMPVGVVIEEGSVKEVRP